MSSTDIFAQLKDTIEKAKSLSEDPEKYKSCVVSDDYLRIYENIDQIEIDVTRDLTLDELNEFLDDNGFECWYQDYEYYYYYKYLHDNVCIEVTVIADSWCSDNVSEIIVTKAVVADDETVRDETKEKLSDAVKQAELLPEDFDTVETYTDDLKVYYNKNNEIKISFILVDSDLVNDTLVGLGLKLLSEEIGDLYYLKHLHGDIYLNAIAFLDSDSKNVTTVVIKKIRIEGAGEKGERVEIIPLKRAIDQIGRYYAEYFEVKDLCYVYIDFPVNNLSLGEIDKVVKNYGFELSEKDEHGIIYKKHLHDKIYLDVIVRFKDGSTPKDIQVCRAMEN